MKLSIIILLTIGIILRLIFAGMGYTYDLESYQIVGEIVTSGGNVYEETTRYNYGPIWFLFIGVAYWLSRFFPDPFLFFRFFITGFLVCVDVGIWYLLQKRYSLKISLLFFLSPVSIILTGYYSQFDNLAVFLGLLAVLYLEKQFLFGLVLLGISMMTKHIFFAFPLWLFFSEKVLKKKLLILTVPLVIFSIGFLPFLQEGYDGIKNNVFLYKSFNNAPLWQFLVPDYLKRLIRKELLFFGMLLLGGFIFRKKKPFEQLLFYTLTLITFSYAIADQYFAIVLPALSVFFNIFFVGFIFIQVLFFLMVLHGGEVNWYGFFLDRNNFSFTAQIVFLLSGFIFALYRQSFQHFHFRHLIVVLFLGTVGFYSFIVFPSWQEDRRIESISLAIKNDNYELANSLYSDIERNPPFAGSRFWYKLSNIRYAVEYYRKFRHTSAVYEDSKTDVDWKQVEQDLRIIPPGFPEQEKVGKILERAKQEIVKEDLHE